MEIAEENSRRGVRSDLCLERGPALDGESFQVPGRKGDTITISWLDNRGNSDSATTKVR